MSVLDDLMSELVFLANTHFAEVMFRLSGSYISPKAPAPVSPSNSLSIARILMLEYSSENASAMEFGVESSRAGRVGRRGSQAVELVEKYMAYTFPCRHQ